MRGCLRLLLAVFVLSLLSEESLAQWTPTAVGLLGRHSTIYRGSHEGSGGAMSYRDGNLWAGFTTLWRSQDQGVTWSPIAFPIGSSDFITDIDFYDQLNGIITTDSGGVYLTSNAGATWKNIYAGTYNFSARYDGGPSDIIALVDGGIAITRNAGVSWTTLSPFLQAICLATARDGTAYVLSTTPPNVEFNKTTDYGTTWSSTLTTIQHDCWSMSIDSCSEDELFLTNEGYWNHTVVNQIYTSRDGAASWQIAHQHDSAYYTGSLALGLQCIYVPTLANGILKSKNLGKSWSSAGGPAGLDVDSRLIAAIDDNTVVVADSNGTIWRTTNGGGDSITVLGGGQDWYVLPEGLFANDTLTACDSTSIRKAAIFTRACARWPVVTQSITGPDSAYFTLVQGVPDTLTGIDSITVYFHPDSTRDYYATFGAQLDSSFSLFIPLFGHGLGAVHIVSIGPQLLFDHDSTSICLQPLVEPVVVYSKSCKPIGVVSVRITGPDSTRYRITHGLPSTLTGSDTLMLSFMPDSVRAFNATVIITLDDGTVQRITLGGRGTKEHAIVEAVPNSLFVFDTTSICSPVERTSALLEGSCRHHAIIAQKIIGADSNFYQIVTSAASDTGRIAIAFAPDSLRVYHAIYIAIFDDSSTARISLSGVGKDVARSLAFTDRHLFDLDSISLCDAPLTRTLHVHDSSCATWDIRSIRVVGPDATEFTITRQPDSPLQPEDSLSLTFRPQAVKPDHFATLVITMSNDSTYSFPLVAHAKPIVRTLSFTPMSLFASDTVLPCGSPVTEIIAISDSSCVPWRVRSIEVTGPDSTFYLVQFSLPYTLTGEDTIPVSFVPDSARDYHATLLITLDDGTNVSVPFLGVGGSRATMSLASLSVQTDAIGDEIDLPLWVVHSGSVAPVGLTVQYDTSVLQYGGSFMSRSGTRIDVAQPSWPGHARVLLDTTSAVGDTLQAFARFRYFPTTDSCTSVVIDSMTFESPLQCVTLAQAAVTVTICGPSNCTTPILSRYMRFGTLPSFSVQPNPTHDRIVIHSNQSLTDVHIRVVDAIGIPRLNASSFFDGSRAIELDLRELANGLYFIEISGDNFESTLPIVKR